MSKYEAGFLGAGNMGGALAAAAARQVTGAGRRLVQHPRAQCGSGRAARLPCGCA